MVDISQIDYDWERARQREAWYAGSEQRGVIILADISGYTGLLAAAELSTATKVVAHITERVFRATTPAFIVNELEGDALFTYTVEPPSGEELFRLTLGQLEAYADAFYHAMEELSASTLQHDQSLQTLLANVSMKFVVHYGSFQFHSIGPFTKLVGPDVILAHRLLKNAVDSDSYFLFTKDFLALDIDEAHAKATTHVETVRHFGSVDVGYRTFDYDAEHDLRHGTTHDHLTRRGLNLG